MPDFPIGRLIERTLHGEIRIPAFQRGFVWDPDAVAFLMDSIYRGYPIGSLLFWRASARLESDKTLGPYRLPEPEEDYPLDYVLDGQQRLTALFGTFQTELSRTESVEWLDIFFDLNAPEGAFEGQFVALRPEDVVPAQHLALRTFYDSVAYRAQTSALGSDEAVRCDEVQRKFLQAQIPVQTIESPDREQVAIIFERVNRAGVLLDTYQLLAAWTWSTEFDLRERFQDLRDELEPYGFGEVGIDSNLLLKCCSAVVTGKASPKALIELQGPDVRERFDEIVSGVHSAIDFLREQLKVSSLRVMPYPSMIVPLTAFFASTARSGYSPTNKQRTELLRWFWRACFSRRYSGGVGRAHAADIAGMKGLREDEEHVVSDFACSIEPDFFLENQFNVIAVNSKIHMLLLAQRQPLSLLSGNRVPMEEVLKVCNRAEFHHIYSERHLAASGVPKKDQSALANMAVMTAADNQLFKGKGPDAYAGLVAQQDRPAILSSNYIGALDWFDLDYPAFLRSRAAALVEYARSLVS